jgi:uncharacterized protein YegL
MNKSVTEIIFLLDRSGSMAGLESETIKGFNSFIESQAAMEGRASLTVVLFDDLYEVLWSGIDAKKAKLTEKEYFVRGSTALLDAIGKAITDTAERLSRLDEKEKPQKVIFVVTTDGLENSSVEFSYKKIKNMISYRQKKHGWEFIFLGANIDVAKEAEFLGIHRNDAFRYEATKEGMGKMYYMLSEKVRKRRTNKKKNGEI